MSGPIGPHEAQIRALRESRHEQRQKAALAKISAKPEKVAKARALSNAPESNKRRESNKRPESNRRVESNMVAESNAPDAPFDRAAYQRDLMRKRRAAAKAAS